VPQRTSGRQSHHALGSRQKKSKLFCLGQKTCFHGAAGNYIHVGIVPSLLMGATGEAWMVPGVGVPSVSRSMTQRDCRLTLTGIPDNEREFASRETSRPEPRDCLGFHVGQTHEVGAVAA
jgi:hypothetical protein